MRNPYLKTGCQHIGFGPIHVNRGHGFFIGLDGEPTKWAMDAWTEETVKTVRFGGLILNMKAEG